MGFTHALQIDADCQHNTKDIPAFLALSRMHPKAIISGVPIYDHSVPKSRLYGRRITNFWVMIETLSFQVKDAMCGFRLYPVNPVIQLVEKTKLQLGMGFDIDILVRLIWEGITVLSQSTKVIYPADGISHFKLLRDNLRISWTHTRLFFGMLLRSPLLLFRRYHSNEARHWSAMKEVGVLSGLKITLWCYQVFGKAFTYFLLHFLSFYFYMTNPSARNASKKYLNQLKDYGKLKKKHSSYQHFLSYAQSIVDKLAVWHGDISIADLDIEGAEYLTNPATKKGGVILTAHLGNMDIARALSQLNEKNIVINVLVFQKNAVMINQILNQVNPDFSVNLIAVENISISMMLMLSDKVASGEYIVIAADRTSVAYPNNVFLAHFLGKEAAFPKGAFILSALLDCPVFFMLCLKSDKKRYRLIVKEFAPSLGMERSTRDLSLKQYVQQYADFLSQYCLKYPLQWFNFYDFWKKSMKK